MANNYSSKYFGGATNGVIVTVSSTDFSRVVAIHAAAVTTTGTFAITQKSTSEDKIKFQVPASGTADIYIGDDGIRFKGTVSVSAPSNGSSVTLILG
jgi:hypothetical protein|tara:strand:+ start:1605 stop:1895 length:291 start_codon:yes stop_codon:yes gene_type:complete